MHYKTSITITEIARRAHLSPSSVSRVLNGREGVSEAVRHKVGELLRQMNYTSSNHLNREKKIGIVTPPSSFSSYLAALFKGIERASFEMGINYCLVTHTGHERQSLLENIREHRCSGVIIIHPHLYAAEMDEVLNSELLVVALDDPTFSPRAGSIVHDMNMGMTSAFHYLFDLGHRHIGYVKSVPSSFASEHRFMAYRNEMEKAGLKLDNSYVVEADYDDIMGSVKKIKILLETHPEVTALMTNDDFIASVAMRAASEVGRKVPENLSIIGFDNTLESALFAPSLTTVDHHVCDVAYLATKELTNCLKNPLQPLPNLILPTQLVIRESTAPVKTL